MIQLHLDTYTIVSQKVEVGVRFGISRFNKYAEVPLDDEQTVALSDHLEREIMNALTEAVDFDQEKKMFRRFLGNILWFVVGYSVGCLLWLVVRLFWRW